eukprot:scaffold1986_cov117-Isochrysis_galbana.AAC.4
MHTECGDSTGVSGLCAGRGGQRRILETGLGPVPGALEPKGQDVEEVVESKPAVDGVQAIRGHVGRAIIGRTGAHQWVEGAVLGGAPDPVVGAQSVEALLGARPGRRRIGRVQGCGCTAPVQSRRRRPAAPAGIAPYAAPPLRPIAKGAAQASRTRGSRCAPAPGLPDGCRLHLHGPAEPLTRARNRRASICQKRVRPIDRARVRTRAQAESATGAMGCRRTSVERLVKRHSTMFCAGVASRAAFEMLWSGCGKLALMSLSRRTANPAGRPISPLRADHANSYREAGTQAPDQPRGRILLTQADERLLQRCRRQPVLVRELLHAAVRR